MPYEQKLCKEGHLQPDITVNLRDSWEGRCQYCRQEIVFINLVKPFYEDGFIDFDKLNLKGGRTNL